MYNIHSNIVECDGTLIFQAPGEIKSYFDYNGKLILHYKVANEDKPKYSIEDIARNVLSVDFNGNVLWRLEMPAKSTLPFQPNYQDLREDEEGNFWAFDGGYTNRFEPDTGKIIERIFTK